MDDTKPPVKIEEIQRNAHGEPAPRGFYAISPQGNVVLLAPGQPVKPGFRVATQEDLDAAAAKEAARKRGPAIAAAPKRPTIPPPASSSSEPPAK